MPVGHLDAEGLRLLIGQQEGLDVLVPLAVEKLAVDPLTQGDFHPGDLLVAVLGKTSGEYWRTHPEERARPTRALDALPAEADTDVTRATQTFAWRGNTVPSLGSSGMDSRVRRWVVWRQDDNGNRYEVARFDDRSEAQALADSLEATGHRQIYWIAPTPEQPPATA